jgi:hypothetical protein
MRQSHPDRKQLSTMNMQLKFPISLSTAYSTRRYPFPAYRPTRPSPAPELRLSASGGPAVLNASSMRSQCVLSSPQHGVHGAPRPVVRVEPGGQRDQRPVAIRDRFGQGLECVDREGLDPLLAVFRQLRSFAWRDHDPAVAGGGLENRGEDPVDDADCGVSRWGIGLRFSCGRRLCGDRCRARRPGCSRRRLDSGRDTRPVALATGRRTARATVRRRGGARRPTGRTGTRRRPLPLTPAAAQRAVLRPRGSPRHESSLSRSGPPRGESIRTAAR